MNISDLSNMKLVDLKQLAHDKGINDAYKYNKKELIDVIISKLEKIEKLEKELKYAEGFLMSVNKKLSNEKFVANAPEKVIAMERKKLSDAEAKISILKEQIEILKK